MGYVYILLLKNGRYYIGSTNNIERRMLEHEKGRVESTKYLRPLRLIFNKTYDNIKEARSMEYKLKKQKDRAKTKSFMKGEMF